MKRPQKKNKKLLAMLLSMAMIFTSIPQGMQAYAAETVETVQTDESDVDNVAADENVSVSEEAGEEASVPAETDAANEETKEDSLSTEETKEDGLSTEETEEERFSTEETGSDNAGSEAVDENGSDTVLTEEEVSSEETSSEEMSSGEMSSEEEESETEEETDEVSLKTAARNASTARASDFSSVGGWNESIYAEIAGIADTDVTEVRYSGAVSGVLDDRDLAYLVRKSGKGVRIDVPGLKAGTYTLTVKVGQESVLTKSGIKVYEYDRSGFAHFKYSDGVGAYNDDGTLKDDAIVLYVTDENKNDVELTVGKITVRGIGNILNSVGQDAGGGKTSNGGKANTNQGIIKELAKAGKPLVVRFIGTVSDSGLYEKGTFNAASKCLIEGLTTYSSVDNGGTVGDNGHMARIQSGKDITFEGIGYDAVIDGWGFHYIAQTSDPEFGKSFEVRNLTFINTPEDAIGMEGQQAGKNAGADITASVERCWIHNNEFYCPSITSPAESDKGEGDGSVDFKRGQYFTCSYNYFDSCHKTNLVGSADYSLQFNLTYHHNYWYMCKARGPLTRRANVHMYNNVVDMQTDYAQNTRADAYIFSEYNIFYACKSPQAVEGGAIKSYNDSISSVIWNKGSAATVVTDKSEYVSNNCQFSARGIKYDKFDTDSSQSYIPDNNYELQTDFADLRKVIAVQTGVQEKSPKRPESVSKSEYSVISRMASNVNQFDSLPQDLVPGKISKSVYAFEVGAAFDLQVEYASGSKAVKGVLVNEEGESLLTGDGNAINLPAGRYMIQAENFQPGDPTKGTIVVFKDMTINSLKISQHDENAHYHKWELDSTQSVEAACTEEGKNVYVCKGSGTCEDNNGIKEETVPALGHSYSKWTVDKPATETEAGSESRTCTRCGDKQTQEIPAGGSGTSGGNTGGNTVAGDYVLYFTGKKLNGDTDFFSVINGNYKDGQSPVTVNGEEYTDGLKMESKTQLSFSCNSGATLVMAFGAASKKVNVDGAAYTTDAKGFVTIENLSSGSHTVTKGDSMNLFYVSVANGASSDKCTISFEYNYDDSPDARTITVSKGTSYASVETLVPSSFTRRGYTLKGLYTDADCMKPVTYPYEANGNVTLYADWEATSDDEVTYSLIFDSNGGSVVTTVRVSQSQVYEIKQRPTKNGYTFAGWYDALEGGKLVDKVDGSKLTGNITVYAHWSASEADSLSLDCKKDLVVGDIKEKTTVNGFTIHALEGGGGSTQDKPKYYMTVKESDGLYTNGVLLSDKSISGNEDGLLKSIEFTTKDSGVLIVDLALSGKPASDGKYELVLAKKLSDNSLEEVIIAPITTGTTKTTKEFDIDEAGTYYLYAQGDKGVVYYSLKVTQKLYTIVYRTGNGTAPNNLKTSAKAGDVIQIPDCTPESGYTFKGWSLDGGTTVFKDSYTVKAKDASGSVIVISAVYEQSDEKPDEKPVIYTVKYDANGGTLPAGVTGTVTAAAGDAIMLGDCTPPAGQKFLGWSVGNSDEIIMSYIVKEADADTNNVITLKAVYTVQEDPTKYFTVVLDPNGGKLVDDGELTRTVAENETIDPGRCEKAGYTFKEWTVDGERIEIPYKVTKDVILKAVYTENELPGEYRGISIVGLAESYEYTGAKIIPDIGVVDYDNGDGKLLSQGVDYTVKYANNVKVGTAAVTVIGKGNYAGRDITKKFRIVEVATVTENLADLKGAKLAKIDALVYTGKAQYPEFTLTLKNGKPKKYSYNEEKRVYETEDGTAIAANVALSNNINKGTATILISGAKDSKNKATSIKKTFKIEAIDLAKNADKVKVETDPGIYAVKGAAPEAIIVTYDGAALKNGTDYTVKYSANRNVTTQARFVITGKGNYAKKYTGTYKIGQLDLNGLEVKAVNAYTGIKAGKVTATVTDRKGDTLKPSQYTLNIYKDAAGTTRYNPAAILNGKDIYVEAVAKDIGNLNGKTLRTPFSVGTNIGKAKVTLNKVNGKTITKTYTGMEIELEETDLTVTIKEAGQSKLLKMGIDYKIVSYSNNINKGTATAVVKGIGSYSGTKTVKFKIVGKAIKIDKVTTWEDIPDSIERLMKNLWN